MGNRQLTLERAITMGIGVVASLALAPAPATQDRMAGAGSASAAESVSLVGCLEAAPDGGGFVLKDARPAASGSAEVATSAGAGASVTGEGPSGSVSAATPTGSTSTETSAPTPEAGAPEATANPASGDFNRGVRDVTTGTAGTVPRADPAGAAPVSRYRVEGSAAVDLRPHTGHTVRVDGSLKAAAESPDASAEAAAARVPVVTATALVHVADSCGR